MTREHGLAVSVYFLSLALAFGLLWNFPNVDEVGHLTSAYYLQESGRFDLYRVNPPLLQHLSSLFLQRGLEQEFDWRWVNETEHARRRYEFVLGLEVLSKHRLEFAKYYLFPRIGLLAICAGGVFLIQLVYKQAQLGFWPFLVACILWLTWPDFLAHAPTLNPDMLSVLAGWIVAFAGSRYISQPDIWNGTLCGISVGLALLTKLTWIAGGVGFAFILIALTFQSMVGPWAIRLKKLTLHSTVAFFVCLLTLNAGYGFEHVFVPLKEMNFFSKLFGDTLPPHSGNRFEGTLLGELPVPLPRNYLYGIDYLQCEVESKPLSFLNGEWKQGSWPQYYLLTTLYKTPEPTLVAAVLGMLAFAVAWFRKTVDKRVVHLALLLAVPAFACFLSVSLKGGFNHHHRYVLNLYPPLFLFASFLASPTVWQTGHAGRRIFDLTSEGAVSAFKQSARWIAISLALLSAASSLSVYPHFISYFNLASGGAENGWKRLSFSNVDWGQDILLVEQWIQEHPECVPTAIELDYFLFGGELVGIACDKAPVLYRDGRVDEIRKPHTQWFIISVKLLFNAQSAAGLEYLQQLEPIDRIGYAYHVYRIDPIENHTPSSDSVGDEVSGR